MDFYEYSTIMSKVRNPARCKSFISGNFEILNTPKILTFDQDIVTAGIKNENGVFTVSETGIYIGSLSGFIDQSSFPDVWFYLEHMPKTTQTWVKYRNLAQAVKVDSDNGMAIDLGATMNLIEGDKFRIGAIIDGNGSATFTTKTKTIDGVTVTQHSAILTVYQV